MPRASCSGLESITAPRFPEDPGSPSPQSGAVLVADGRELRPSLGTALGRRRLGTAPSQQGSTCSSQFRHLWGPSFGVGPRRHCSLSQFSFSPTSHLHANTCHCLLAGEPNLRHTLSYPQPHPLCITQLPLASATMLPRPGIYQAPCISSRRTYSA